MYVSILALDGVFDSGLAILLDTLGTANELAGRVLFEIALVGVRRNVVTAHGLKVPLARAADSGPRPEMVIVPALGCKTPETLTTALERNDVADACAQLRVWSKANVRIAAACTATFVLAMSGILDGGRATTTWWLSPVFRQRFPNVGLDEASMIVPWSRVVTAGAALAHVDLALWLIRQRSPSVAEATARYLMFDARPSQGAFIMPDHLAHADPMVERFESWARRHLAGFSLSGAARHVGASERTLERRIRAVLGRTPLSYVRDLRVEMALHRLRTTTDSIEQIANAVGYQDGVTLRTLLRKKTGRGMRELRTTARANRQ